jgi:hypothetical protein
MSRLDFHHRIPVHHLAVQLAPVLTIVSYFQVHHHLPNRRYPHQRLNDFEVNLAKKKQLLVQRRFRVFKHLVFRYF